MIKIKIGDESSPLEADSVDGDGDPVATIRLNVRKDLNGNYMVFDHGDIDIVIRISDNKILTFPKEKTKNTDIVYDAQNRLINYLVQNGVADPETAKGGPILGCMEVEYYHEGVSEDINASQVVLFTLGKFIEEERPYYMFRQAQEEAELERLYDPDEDYSTELGEVPHGEFKGSIPQRIDNWGANYGIYESENKEK